MTNINICGESIDFYDNYILTGSWDCFDQLKLWDIRMYSQVSAVDNNSSNNHLRNSYIYSCKFSKHEDKGDYIISTGSNNNILSLYSKTLFIDNLSDNDSKVMNRQISLNTNFSNDSPEKQSTLSINSNILYDYIPNGATYYLDNPCYKSDFISSRKMIVSAWADGNIRIYSY